MSIRTRLALGMLALLAVVLAVVGVLLYTLVRAQVEAQVADELNRTADEFAVLATQGVDPATGQAFTDPERLIEVALTRLVLAPHEGAVGYVDGELEWEADPIITLRPEDDPELRARLDEIALLDHGALDGLTTERGEYRFVVTPVRFLGNERTGALVKVVDMAAQRGLVDSMLRQYVLVAMASLVLASVLAWFWVRRLLRPLGALRDTAERISESDLAGRVPVHGTGDLAALATTVNHMLDRIETGVHAQRQLVDDVGHELRTPVTIVRGHLELMDPDDPADVRATSAVATEELVRMGGLVDDLILLAKSAQPDFVRPAWTEVATLTDSVLDRARGLGERRWKIARIAEGEAWLDAGRITQAWLQLAANAVKYSEPGSPVSIGSAFVRGRLHLWVSDAGIGIRREDLSVIRTRFGRAAGVRGRIEGSGLGLAIVASILDAHDGDLAITSTPGEGSTFVLDLPIGPHHAREDT